MFLAECTPTKLYLQVYPPICILPCPANNIQVIKQTTQSIYLLIFIPMDFPMYVEKRKKKLLLMTKAITCSTVGDNICVLPGGENTFFSFLLPCLSVCFPCWQKTVSSWRGKMDYFVAWLAHTSQLVKRRGGYYQTKLLLSRHCSTS